MNFSEIWNSIVGFFEANGWSIVVFLAVLVVGVIAVRALCFAINRLLLRSRVEKTLVGFIVTVCRFVLYLILVFVLAGIIGIDMSPLASALAAGLVAIGLALQDSLSNIANGVIIISTHPFKEGDYVSIGGTEGTVKSIGMFVTELITPDNKNVMLTNSKVISDYIINYSERPTRRVDMVFPVSYSSDTAKAMEILRSIAAGHELILADPEPNVRIHEFGDSSINIICRVWVNNDDYWTVYWDMNERVFAAFGEAGIEIPFKQIDVRLRKEDDK